MEDAKKAGSAYIDTMTGVKDTVDKVTGSLGKLKDELIDEGNIAGQIADKRAKAIKLERDLITERADANRKRADLLNKAVDKENFKLDERIGFLKEAGRIEDEITSKELAAAKLRLDAKVLENAQANSTTADLNEEAQLRANLIDLETAKLRKAKLVTTQISALNAEARATELVYNAATYSYLRSTVGTKKAVASFIFNFFCIFRTLAQCARCIVLTIVRWQAAIFTVGG